MPGGNFLQLEFNDVRNVSNVSAKKSPIGIEVRALQRRLKPVCG